MTQRALVLSGGGAKGAFQVGAIHHLVEERGLEFQVIAGISTGALSAIVLAQADGLDELRRRVEVLEKLWFGIRSSADVYRGRFLGRLLAFLFQDSVYDPEPLRRQLRDHVDLEKLRRSKVSLCVGAVGLESGDYVVADQSDPLARDWAVASASIPCVFPPVQVRAMTLVDGGVRNITPLQDAVHALKRRAEPGEPLEMYVLMASPLDLPSEPRRWRSALGIGKRALSITMNEMLREDLKYALVINRAVQAYERLRAILASRAGPGAFREEMERFPYRPPRYRHVEVHAVAPEREYAEGLKFDPEMIRGAFEAGREAARRPRSGENLEAALHM